MLAAEFMGEAKPPRRRSGRPTGSSPRVGPEIFLRITCELLKTKHHEEITRALVARLAGADPSLIRYYFKSYDDLLFAAAEQIGVEFARFEAEAMTVSDGSPESRLFARIHAVVEMTATYPFYSRLLSEKVMNSDNPNAKALFGRLMDRGIRALTAILDDGCAAGRFQPVDPKMLFSTIIGMAEFFLHTRRRAELSSFPDESGDPETMKARYRQLVIELIFSRVLVDRPPYDLIEGWTRAIRAARQRIDVAGEPA